MVSKPVPPPHAGGKDSQEHQNAQLQVRIAEYQAITTRNTYWLTLQYALFPILGAGVAVLAQMWNQFGSNPAIDSYPHRIIIWFVTLVSG